jgi:hypothetical protein
MRLPHPLKNMSISLKNRTPVVNSKDEARKTQDTLASAWTPFCTKTCLECRLGQEDVRRGDWDLGWIGKVDNLDSLSPSLSKLDLSTTVEPLSCGHFMAICKTAIGSTVYCSACLPCLDSYHSSNVPSGSARDLTNLVEFLWRPTQGEGDSSSSQIVRYLLLHVPM